MPIEGNYPPDRNMVNRHTGGHIGEYAEVDLEDTGETVRLQVRATSNAPGARPTEARRWLTVEDDETEPTLLKASPTRGQVLIPA